MNAGKAGHPAFFFCRELWHISYKTVNIARRFLRMLRVKRYAICSILTRI